MNNQLSKSCDKQLSPDSGRLSMKKKQRVLGKEWLSKSVLLVALLVMPSLAARDAQAITVGGNEYEKMFELKTVFDFGFWSRADKFFTFIGNDNYIKPNSIYSVKDKDPKFNGTHFSKIQAMGTSVPDDTEVATGVFDLYGANNTLLLSGTYISDGTIDYTLRRGFAGQLNVNGVFNVTGGSLFDQGLVSSQLYLDISYDYVWKNSSIDLKTNRGTWSFFDSVIEPEPPLPPLTEVPEPMSLSLLAAGLFGATKFKRKKVV